MRPRIQVFAAFGKRDPITRKNCLSNSERKMDHRTLRRCSSGDSRPTCPERSRGALRVEGSSTAALTTEQFGVMFLKHRSHAGRRPVLHGVDILDQRIGIGGHYQQISDQPGPRVPIGVWRTMRHKNRGTGAHLYYIIPQLNTQAAFEHIPGFVIVAVKVKWSNPARRPWLRANILPLRDHKARADRTD